MAGATDREGLDSETADGGSSDGLAGEPAPKGLSRGQGLGRYIIVDELGAGGMGIVYSAFDPDLDRKVAVKVLRKRQDRVARSRLLLEAQAMAKLSHPNVVTVYEVDTESGRDYIVMEYVDGMTLAAWGTESHCPRTILSVYLQAGRGLAAAHKAGVVHRDFKPQNVLIGQDERVRVTDFGLAYRDEMEGAEERSKRESESELSPDLVKTGTVAGTPGYMAPEQVLGLSTDARSDQFSFCVALFEALSGEAPFSIDTRSGNEEVSSWSPPKLPESVALPSGVSEALTRGMSEERGERFESMDALLDSLESSARPKKGKAWAIAATVIAITLAALAFFVGVSSSRGGDVCEADPSILEGTWDSKVQVEVREAFERAAGTKALAVYGKFATILDLYGQQIVQMRLSICRASRAPQRMDDELLVLQMSCLQKRKQELGAVSAAFSKVDPRGVDRAVSVARGLRDISECSDVDALQRGVAKPAMQHRDEVLSLQTSLEKALSQGQAGHVKDAIVRAETARDRSLELKYKPLQAEAYSALGKLYGGDLRIQEAELSYEEAILAAEESGHTEYRARALAGMTQLVAGGSSRFSEARRYARRAKAAIAQWGRAPELRVEVDVALAAILVKEGEVEGALAIAEESLQSYRGEKDPKAVSLAKLQMLLCEIKQHMGMFREAMSLATSSYELSRDELGDSNVRTVSYLSRIADIHRMLGEYEQARTLDTQLIAHWNSEEAQSLLKEDEDYVAESRDLSGKVINADGVIVSGATVVCGKILSADGRYLDAAWSVYSDALHRKRVVKSDSFGNFLCSDTTAERLAFGAEHPEFGRSDVLLVEAGTEKVKGVVLTLHPTGFLSGTVAPVVGPKRARTVSLTYADSEVSNPRLVASTFVRLDNSYSFERLAPGRYKIFSGTSETPSSTSVRFKEVEVVSSQGAQLDFVGSGGDSGIRLQVKATGGAPLFSAQVLVVSGHVNARSGKEFNRLVSADGLRLRNVFYSEGDTLLIDKLEAGLYSVCLIPLGGDYRDPEYTKRFTPEAVEQIAVYCEDLQVPSDKIIESSRVVPPWKPDVSLQGEGEPGKDPS